MTSTESSASIEIDQTRAHVTAICPFCSGEYTAGFIRVPGASSEPAILHTEPMCPKFLRLEPNDFLEAARKAGAVVIGGGGDRN